MGTKQDKDLKVTGSEETSENVEYKDLKFTDDFMFCKIMHSKPEYCKRLLEIVLDKKITKIMFPEKQKVIDIAANSKSVRLDVYVEDEDCIYDIEMQVARYTNLSRRTRYYQGLMDLGCIEKGESYDKLKKSYIIFFCMYDPFNLSRVKYTFEQLCREVPGLRLGDDAQTIFINPFGFTYGLSKEMQNLMSYLRGEVLNEGFASLLEEEVKKARVNEEWRLEYMKLILRDQENYDKGFNKGIVAARFSDILSTMEFYNVDLETAMSGFHISEQDKELFRKMFKEYRQKQSSGTEIIA